MIGFDPVVRVRLGVVERGRDQLIGHGPQRPGPVGHDLDRLAMGAERGGEEPPRLLTCNRTARDGAPSQVSPNGERLTDGTDHRTNR